MSERQIDSNHASTKSNVIAFIAFGENNTRQAIFSICSILLCLKQRHPSFSLVVYSNHTGQFEFLKKYIQISIRGLIDEEVRQAIHPENYFPKLKIILMNEMLGSESIKNLILVDSDTIFLKKPMILFKYLDNGYLLMHLFEWIFKKGRKDNPVLCPKDGNIALASGRIVEWSDNSHMYNVGVIGIGANKRNLIKDSLDFIIKYFAIYPSWHVEQLCVSLLFQQYGRIHFAKKQIYHYWHSKPIFTKLTRKFFSLIDSGRHQEALNEARYLIPRMVIEMQTRFFLARAKVWFRDLPGVYLVYKTLVKPFNKI
jgi:hypothetical protein